MSDPRYDDLTNCYTEAKAAWGPWLTRADECLRMYLGDQWSADEKKHFEQYKRCGYIFNRLRRVVRIISGYERKNRLALKIGGFGNEDDIPANQLTNVVMRTMNRNGYSILSDCFKFGSLITGMNLIWMYRDVFGDIAFNRSPHNETLLDPGFTDRTLQNCGYILRGKWITGRDILKLFAGEVTEQEVARIYPDAATTSRWNVGKMQGRIASQDRRGLDKIHLVEEHWHQTTRNRLITLDPDTGSEMEIPGDNPEYLAQLSEAGAPIQESTIPTISLSLFADGNWVKDIENPYKLDDYPAVFVGGEFCPEMEDFSYRLQGFIQCILDPQRADNRRMNQMLDITEVSIYNLIIAKMDSLVDPEGLASGANRKTLFIKKGASTDDVVTKPSSDVPAGLFNLQQILDQQITEIPGINEELFGTENNDVSGVLSKLRQGGALNVLQGEFDDLRQSKSELGRKQVLMVQGNYPRQKVKRIINEDPDPAFYRRDFVRYDCVPQEGVLTDSQREMFFVELKEMFETGMYPIPPSLVMKNMPSADKKQIIDAVKQSEAQMAQQAATAQKLQEVTEALTAAKLKTEVAKADELHTQAEENKTTEALNRVKTAVEIQNLKKYGQEKPPRPQPNNPKSRKRGR